MNSKQFLNEGLADDAGRAEQDHEVQMARADCFYAAQAAIKLHQLLGGVSEQQGLPGWVSEKVTLAADYLKSVAEYMEHENAAPMAPLPAIDPNMVPPLAESMEDDGIGSDTDSEYNIAKQWLASKPDAANWSLAGLGVNDDGTINVQIMKNSNGYSTSHVIDATTGQEVQQEGLFGGMVDKYKQGQTDKAAAKAKADFIARRAAQAKAAKPAPGKASSAWDHGGYDTAQKRGTMEEGAVSEGMWTTKNRDGVAKKFRSEQEASAWAQSYSAPAAPKAVAPAKKPGLDLDTVWRKVEDVVGQIFPDGDPIDYLAPWLEKHGIRDFKIGDTLNAAAKKHGYEDIYAYYDSLKADYGDLNEVSREKLVRYADRAISDHGMANFASRATTDPEYKREMERVRDKRAKGISRAYNDERLGGKLREDESGVDTDKLLADLTTAWRGISTADFYTPEGKQAIGRIYDSLRADLMSGNFDAFEATWDRVSAKSPDAFGELAEAAFEAAGLDEQTGTYEDWIATASAVSEAGIGKKIKRAVAGWGASYNSDSPAELVKRNKGHDDSTNQLLRRRGTPPPKGSPAALQQRVLDREAKKRGIDEAQGDTIEAHGVRGMDRKQWRRTFKSTDQMNAWAEKYDAEIEGTRDFEQSAKGNLSPAVKETASMGATGSGSIGTINMPTSVVKKPRKKVKEMNLAPANSAQAAAGSDQTKAAIADTLKKSGNMQLANKIKAPAGNFNKDELDAIVGAKTSAGMK